MIPQPEYCDKCGRKGKVIRSRRRELGFRFRRRQCPVCGHTWPEFTTRLNPARFLRQIARRRKATESKRN